MGGAIRCPECGATDVTCTENPHDHQCHACGYSTLGGKPSTPSDLAVTVSLADGTQVLVRRYTDGTVEADVRGGVDGRRSWTPVDLVGGSFRVEHLEPSR